jgi:hypothetical protein
MASCSVSTERTLRGWRHRVVVDVARMRISMSVGEASELKSELGSAICRLYKMAAEERANGDEVDDG